MSMEFSLDTLLAEPGKFLDLVDELKERGASFIKVGPIEVSLDRTGSAFKSFLEAELPKETEDDEETWMGHKISEVFPD